jgi:hypothetical protein
MSQESKKQTAVEWLIHELKSLGIYSLTLKEKCEQAKEMEKEEKIGLLKWMNKVASEEPMRFETDADDIVEQYYNEVYGKE